MSSLECDAYIWKVSPVCRRVQNVVAVLVAATAAATLAAAVALLFMYLSLPIRPLDNS